MKNMTYNTLMYHHLNFGYICLGISNMLETCMICYVNCKKHGLKPFFKLASKSRSALKKSSQNVYLKKQNIQSMSKVFHPPSILAGFQCFKATGNLTVLPWIRGREGCKIPMPFNVSKDFWELGPSKFLQKAVKSKMSCLLPKRFISVTNKQSPKC